MASLVQQKQEEQRPLGGRLKSVFPWTLVALLLVGLAPSCSKANDDKSVDIPDASMHVAWVGESESGIRLVLEAIAPPQDVANARFSEESMLRSRLPLEERSTLLRLHLFGNAADLQTAGEVQVGEQKLTTFGDAPGDLDVGQRLLWNSVLRGLPAPDPALESPLHRSVVLQADAATLDPPAGQATWSHQQMEVPLELRSWTEMDRGRFFDQSLTPPKKEDG